MRGFTPPRKAFSLRSKSFRPSLKGRVRCVSESKVVLRFEAKSRRAELARALPDFAQRLNIPADAVVAGYWPVRDEADPRALMKALGTRLALPRIAAKHCALSFRAWR